MQFQAVADKLYVFFQSHGVQNGFIGLTFLDTFQGIRWSCVWWLQDKVGGQMQHLSSHRNSTHIDLRSFEKKSLRLGEGFYFHARFWCSQRDPAAKRSLTVAGKGVTCWPIPSSNIFAHRRFRLFVCPASLKSEAESLKTIEFSLAKVFRFKSKKQVFWIWLALDRLFTPKRCDVLFGRLHLDMKTADRILLAVSKSANQGAMLDVRRVCVSGAAYLKDVTPPKTNQCPLENAGWKTFFLLKWSFFRGHSFILKGVIALFCVSLHYTWYRYFWFCKYKSTWIYTFLSHWIFISVGFKWHIC